MNERSAYRANYLPPRHPLTVFLWPLLALLVLIALVAWYFWPASWTPYDPNARPKPVIDRGPLDEEEQKTQGLYHTRPR